MDLAAVAGRERKRPAIDQAAFLAGFSPVSAIVAGAAEAGAPGS
jgi:hypothetical protein